LAPPLAPSLETLRAYIAQATSIRELDLRELDWQDAVTAFDANPYALEQHRDEDEESTPVVEDIGVPTQRVPLSSHVRVMPRAQIPYDAMVVLDAMGEAQLQLTLDLFCLESAAGVAPYDPSARAAADTLRVRMQELADLRDALNDVYLEASDARAALLFSPGRPLAAYVRGLYVWACAVTASLTTLASSLRLLTPDWHALRCELESASAWNFDGLVPSAREDVASADAPELAERVEELFWAAQLAARGLEKRFG
jgi:hypothetical protein